MPVFWIIALSGTLYALLGYAIWRTDLLRHILDWPKAPTLRVIWIVWIVFLALLAPLSYHEGDMAIWRDAVQQILQGKLLPGDYVYLPIYAQAQAAILWPLHALGLASPLVLVYTIKWSVILGYHATTQLMAQMSPRRSELAPLAIALAPVTVFYFFLGTNHVVMFLFLLGSLALIMKRKWAWAGFFGFLSCYKFLLVPTVLVLVLIVWARYGRRCVVRYLAGGLVSLVPSLIYFAYDLPYLLRLIAERAAIGAHSQQIEPFHFLYAVNKVLPGLEAMYIGHEIWFYLSLLGVPVALSLFRLGRLNLLQSLALSYAFVALFAPEPFRLEPLVGLLWLDAIYRGDLRLQTAVFVVLFTHAAAWYDWANSRYLVFDPHMPSVVWAARGLILGLTVVLALAVVILGKNKADLLLDEEPAQGVKA